jgi:excisionase family DNA binding protein
METSNNLALLLTPGDLAQHLKVPIATVYYWVHRKEIPFIKVGRHLRFELIEVLQSFRERTEDKGACFGLNLGLRGKSPRSLTTRVASRADLPRKE